jgi:Transcription elongation factor, GreA/GreB, C-term
MAGGHAAAARPRARGVAILALFRLKLLPDRVMADLFETLSRMGIEPLGNTDGARPLRRYTEHRKIELPQATVVASKTNGAVASKTNGAVGLVSERGASDNAGAVAAGIGVGDRVVVLFADDHRRISVRLTTSANDPERGMLSITSPLGRAILGAEEGDEIEFQLDDDRLRKGLIESVQKGAQIANGLTPTLNELDPIAVM